MCVCLLTCVRVWMGVGEWTLACACSRVDLLTQYEKRRHIAICSLSGSTMVDIIS